jgi:hypothetical protein
MPRIIQCLSPTHRKDLDCCYVPVPRRRVHATPPNTDGSPLTAETIDDVAALAEPVIKKIALYRPPSDRLSVPIPDEIPEAFANRVLGMVSTSRSTILFVRPASLLTTSRLAISGTSTAICLSFHARGFSATSSRQEHLLVLTRRFYY